MIVLKVRFKERYVTEQRRNVTTQNLGSAELREKLADVQNLTEEMIDSLAKKYLEDLKVGQIHSEGWFKDSTILMCLATYQISKVFLNAYTRMLARDFESQIKSPMTEQQQHLVVFVNAATPSLTLTDMTRTYVDARGIDPTTINTPEQGADTIVWLTLLPRDEHPTGKFFRDRRDVAF